MYQNKKEAPTHVLLLTGNTALSHRQLPGSLHTVDTERRTYCFHINTIEECDQQCPHRAQGRCSGATQPDIVAVRNKNLRHKTTFDIAPANTLLAISEPSSTVFFPDSYTRQFGALHTCQQGMSHRNVHYGQAMLPWFVGYERRDGQTTFTLTRDELAQSPLPPKSRGISLICSSKSFTPGHRQRLRFVERIRHDFGGAVDIYGRGFNEIGDKWEALAPYRHTIAIENCSKPLYWTEKLSDALLAGCHTLYYGCPEIGNHFATGAGAAITPMDIADYASCRKTIESLLESDDYETRVADIAKSRDLVLGRYDMFRTMCDIFDTMDTDAPRTGVTLRPMGLDGKIVNVSRDIFLRTWNKALNLIGV